MTIAEELARIFKDAGTDAFLYARAVDGPEEVAYQADELVVTASVFKTPVLLEVFRQCSSGELAPDQRVKVPASRRVMGPTGLSVMVDDLDISLRDLAFWMMSVSDNTATDVLMEIVGLDRINATLQELGLQNTVLIGDCAELLGSFEDDVGPVPDEGYLAGAGDRLQQWRSLDPKQTNRTTPREICELLIKIWRDEAAPPEACEECRRIMALQVWPHRLRSGFPDGVTLAAKTGTLPGIRNEAGVVQYADGGRYAVGVFTRAFSYASQLPDVDRSIGRSAFAAVENIRAQRTS